MNNLYGQWIETKITGDARNSLVNLFNGAVISENPDKKLTLKVGGQRLSLDESYSKIKSALFKDGSLLLGS